MLQPGEMKGVDERVEKSVFRLFGHIEIMENSRNAKRLYEGSVLEVVEWVDREKDGLIQ